MRLEDPSLFIKSAWIRPEDLSRYEAMGYTTFKLIERGMPSAELLKRVAAYSARRFEGNLAELLLPYCFEQPVRRSRFWTLRYFFKPFQFSAPQALASTGLGPQPGNAFSKAAQSCAYRRSPDSRADFLDAFEHRDCAATDCDSCGYCETISRQAVRIEPEYRRMSLEKFREVLNTLKSGRLWNVSRPPARIGFQNGFSGGVFPCAICSAIR